MLVSQYTNTKYMLIKALQVRRIWGIILKPFIADVESKVLEKGEFPKVTELISNSQEKHENFLVLVMASC